MRALLLHDAFDKLDSTRNRPISFVWSSPHHEDNHLEEGMPILARVNTDQEQSLRAQRIQPIPTLIAFKTGLKVARTSWAQGSPGLSGWSGH